MERFFKTAVVFSVFLALAYLFNLVFSFFKKNTRSYATDVSYTERP